MKNIASVQNILLGTVLILGAILRFTTLNWDSFLSFHPDERNIAWAVTRIHFFDQLNPKFFAYGGLPVYLYRALGELVAWITKNPVWLSDWGHISLIGRHVSAALSTISIALIFLVGRACFSSSVGLLAAALLAFSPWAIREAHFSTTETMLVFFVLLLVWQAQKIGKTPHWKYASRMGIIQGLALGAKTTSLLFALIPLAVIFLPAVREILDKIMPRHDFVKKHLWLVVRQTARHLGIFIGATLIFFLVTSPYTLLDWQHFRESMDYETGVALGRFTVPYTLSFLGTTPYLYQIKTMLWQAGAMPILGLLGIANLIIFYFLKKSSRFRIQHSELRILLIFPLIYFAWNGQWFAKFSRYNVPLLPFITLAAAWLCIEIKRYSRFTGIACVFVLLTTTSLWGLANFSIYLKPQTRIAASQWIADHIPEDAIIYTEHWNDGLPVSLPQRSLPAYHRELLTVYDDPDDERKRTYYGSMLARGDYIIFSTRRIWGTMPRLTTRYPVTSRLYQLLLAEKLGYYEVARFTSYPSFLGITIADDAAEESIQVFDHPEVRIFQNTEKLSEEKLRERLED